MPGSVCVRLPVVMPVGIVQECGLAMLQPTRCVHVSTLTQWEWWIHHEVDLENVRFHFRVPVSPPFLLGGGYIGKALEHLCLVVCKRVGGKRVKYRGR